MGAHGQSYFYLDRNQSRILNLLNTNIVLLQLSRWFGGKDTKLMILTISVSVLPLSLSPKTEVKICVTTTKTSHYLLCTVSVLSLICNTGVVFVADRNGGRVNSRNAMQAYVKCTPVMDDI